MHYDATNFNQIVIGVWFHLKMLEMYSMYQEKFQIASDKNESRLDGVD